MELNEQLRTHARARLVELEKRESELWAALNALEIEAEPFIARMDRARSEWCDVHCNAAALRQLFPEAAKTEAQETVERTDQAMADAPIVEERV